MDYPDATEARVRVLSEAEVAEWLKERGEKVYEHEGRHWRRVAPGFLEPAHPLARMTIAQATRPTRLSWGYRATLQDSDASHANGVIVPYLIRDLDAYDETRLTKRKREALRQCLRQTRIVRLTDTAILREQGYGVYLSYAERLEVEHPLDAEAYRTMVDGWSGDDRRLVLAGLDGDQLLGYMDSFAADGTLYLGNLHVSAASFPTNITTGLYYQSLQAYRRSGLVREAVGGLHRPENPSLTSFKLSLGFEVTSVPSIHHMFGPVKAVFRRVRPLTYYRLTGVEQP